MIAKRTLEKWRKEALLVVKLHGKANSKGLTNLESSFIYSNQKILRMTQELLDQHLINKE